MRVAMLGFGLIGGSIARALAAYAPGAWQVAAWTPTGHGPSRALADGVIAAAAPSPEDALGDADLVVLAAPPMACIALLDDLAGSWRPLLGSHTVVTDVASTKSAITLRAAALGLPFVGGHPMAGSEQVGYGASSADLLVGRPWVIVPSAAPDMDARVRSLAQACRAEPVDMSAAEHDQAVAAISHLPLIAAAALVGSVAGAPDEPAQDWPAARRLAAGGWRDMTRLARGDVAMGTGIATTNAEALAARVRAYIETLEGWAADLEAEGGPDQDAIEARLRSARASLEATP
jgi:prephenate dehydrogenase